MKILFTGGSSFTGYWFLRELAAAGHEVTALFRKPASGYDDSPRRQRVAMASELVRPVHGCSFGDDAFLALVAQGGWDLLCHHAADVTNYKSPDFDAIGAVRNNTLNLPQVLRALADAGCPRILLTGSVFEGGEGAGSQGLPDFSPYGLSKALTAQAFRFYCDRAGLRLGKFVIPNPFGPYEEPRFTGYLMKNWLAGKEASCSQPSYVRDNIHVSLLAKAYADFAGKLPATPGFSRLNPSGYAEGQGAFTLRTAQEMRPRLNLPCAVTLAKQVEFPEPRVRINTDIVDAGALGWDEARAWDEMADYYLKAHAEASAPAR
ncbi:NAD dependent epimerase/dehydratase family protein (plasmid) [Aquisphaera giovannonii]|uniref:NAD dependent epimerase/dehydratase family protein n=1 Tax=Aquisphaera giovannonii TaxID=406548 RepID=A0A5B9WFA4_9BACT|nr:NAD(P)-dependent oxidoreductase [Aquisphaera giovannonii]QEH39227.1 NAD dependent epimerase/dehydratase family protein [Aquisphaera giovannonii]